jgi:hypothetical protein
MTEFPGETARNGPVISPENRAIAGYLSREAELLTAVLDELRSIRAVLERLEQQASEGAREFLPAVRHLLGRRTVKAAASASAMFRNKDGGHL